MRLGIHVHLAGLSLSNTIYEVEKFGGKRSRKSVHDWVQKADLQPADGASPDHVTLDEMGTRINGQQFWPYPAVDPDTNGFRHIRLFTTTTTTLTQQFLQELQRKHDAIFRGKSGYCSISDPPVICSERALLSIF
jgi:putative transposase